MKGDDRKDLQRLGATGERDELFQLRPLASSSNTKVPRLSLLKRGESYADG